MISPPITTLPAPLTAFELHDRIDDRRDALVTASDGARTTRFRLVVTGSVLHRAREEAMLLWLASLVAPEMLRKQRDDASLELELDTFTVDDSNLVAVLGGEEIPTRLID